MCLLHSKGPETVGREEACGGWSRGEMGGWLGKLRPTMVEISDSSRSLPPQIPSSMCLFLHEILRPSLVSPVGPE